MPELVRQVQDDGPRLKDPHGGRATAIHQSRDFRVAIDAHEARGELLALLDVDDPGIVLGAAFAPLKQLLEHHGGLDAVGCS